MPFSLLSPQQLMPKPLWFCLAICCVVSSTAFKPTQCNRPACDAINTACGKKDHRFRLRTRVSWKDTSGCAPQAAAFCPKVDEFASLSILPMAGEVLACEGMVIEVYSTEAYGPEYVLDRIPFAQVSGLWGRDGDGLGATGERMCARLKAWGVWGVQPKGEWRRSTPIPLLLPL